VKEVSPDFFFFLAFHGFEFLKQYIFSCGSADKGIGKGTRSRAEGNQVLSYNFATMVHHFVLEDLICASKSHNFT
jgi:hypothetical protein